MKILVVAQHTRDLLNFRGQLLREFVKANHHVIVCAPEDHADLVEQLSEIGVHFIQLPLDRTGMNPLRDLFTFFYLYRTVSKISPDIVFNASIKPVIYGSLASHLTGVNKICSMIPGLGYAFSGTTLRGRFIKVLVCNLYRLSLSKNHAVFFQNPDDLSLFIRLKIVKEKQAVRVNGSGVDLDHYAGSFPSTDIPTFLLIARLIREKGIIEYVEAARLLKKRYPNVLFRLLGRFDTNPSGIKQAQMEKWRREGVIDYCGEVQDVRPFIAAASVYVLPSYYREGMPRTILEAMAMGRPIITTDAPGCRETVIDGENGFLVPIRSVDALVHAMERFIKNPGLIPKMGKRSREIAMEKFDVHRVNAKIMKTMGLLDPARTKDDFKKNE